MELNYSMYNNEELVGYWLENGEADNDDLIDLVIPDGVEVIGYGAFSWCSKISSVVIPGSVRKIGYAAFEYCKNLISVTIQEGLEVIRDSAFYGCENLRTINIPDSVREIGDHAFSGCESLETFKIGKQRELLGSDVFGRFPERLKSSLINLLPYIYDSAKFDYICLLDEESLREYGEDRVMSIVLTEMRNVTFLYGFMDDFTYGYTDGKIWDTVKFAKAIAKRIRKNGSNRICLIAANYIAMHYKRIDADSLRTIYAAIKKANHSDAAVRIIESDKTLMAKMGYEAIGMPDNPLEHLVLEETADHFKFTKSDDGHRPPLGILQNMIGWIVSYMYEIPLDKMHFPQLKDINGNVVSEFVVEWLMVENEDFWRIYEDKPAHGESGFGQSYDYKEKSLPEGCIDFSREEEKIDWGARVFTRVNIYCFKIQSGYNKSTEKILQLIDGDSLQEALLQIAKEYVKGEVADHDKLAIPISRFANEKTFMEVSKKLRGKLASACVVNRTRAGLDFAYHHGYIKEYAAAMGLGEGTVRSMVYFDIDLDANGCKTCDLGNQSVKAVFQPADGLMIEMPNGKLLKSFPKASSDNELYHCTKKDFAKLKKACQDAYDNYEYGIHKSFLSGCEWRVEWWEEAFHSNYIINYLARRVVWEQGGKTFMMKENGFVDSSLLPYSLSKEPIRVAHPMEMSGNDIRFWGKYLVNNEMDAWQMSEPIVNMDNVRKDRYAGVQLELLNYFGLERDGIYVTFPLQDEDDELGLITYELDLEDVHVRSMPVMFTDENDGNYEAVFDVTKNDKIKLYSIEIENPSRYANHVIATLDKIVVNEWIMKDDVSISDSLQEFTRPQILEFVKTAQDANSANVLAILLDYLDEAKDDYDLMGESEPS